MPEMDYYDIAIREIGDKLGYEIIQRLGRGGFGIVYKAIQKSIKRPVAIKMLKPELSVDEDFINRFLREARVMAKLDHENIVQVFDMVKHRTVHQMIYCIIMEYIGGDTLKELVGEEGRLPVGRTKKIITQVAEAISFAHNVEYESEGRQERGIIHRDIKPENIKVKSGDRVKVMDFGIARMAVGASFETATGIRVGTEGYMPPEQILGLEVTPAIDVYALGVVLYEALFGKLPFSSNEEALDRLLHKKSTFPWPKREAASIPKGFRRLLQKALEPDKRARCQTVVEFLEQLRAIEVRGGAAVSVPEKTGKIARHYQAGCKFLREKNYEKAATEFNTVLNLYPQHSRAGRYLRISKEKLTELYRKRKEQERELTERHQRGKDSYEKGNYKKAITEFTRVLSLDSTNLEARNYGERCRLELTEGRKRTRAVIVKTGSLVFLFLFIIVSGYLGVQRWGQYREGVKKERIEKLLNEGRSVFSQGRYEKAKEVFDQVLRFDSTNTRATEYLAEANRRIAGEQRLKKEQLAAQLYGQGKEYFKDKNYRQAIEKFNEVIKIKSGYQEALALKQKAEKEWNKVRAAEERKKKIKSYLAEGDRALKDNDYPKAIRLAEKTLGLDPVNEEAEKLKSLAQKRQEINRRYEEAKQYLEAGNYAEAIKKSGRILALDPDYQKAIALKNRARVEWERVKAEEERRQMVQSLLAKAREANEAKDYGGTIAFLEKVLNVDPDNEEAKSLKVRALGEQEIDRYMKKGKELWAKKDYQEAIIEFGKVLELNKTHKKAAAYKEKARKAKKDYAQGLEAYQAGKYEDAERLFERVPPGWKEAEKYLKNTKAHLQDKKIKMAFKEGKELFSKGDYEKSINRLEQIPREHELYKESREYLQKAYFDLGVVSLREDRYEKGKRAFTKVVEMNTGRTNLKNEARESIKAADGLIYESKKRSPDKRVIILMKMVIPKLRK